MTRVYLGFAAALHDILTRRMRPLAEEYDDEWTAAAALVPTLDAKFRDQLATEHLVRCYRLAHDIADPVSPLLKPEKGPGKRPGPPPGTRPPAEALLVELGLNREAVKQWAVSAGLIPAVRPGSIKLSVIEAYVMAHQDAIPAEHQALPPEQPRASRERKPRSDKGREHRTTELLRSLGISSKQVKEWAVSKGMLAAVTRGNVRMDLIEAYALAHQDAFPAPDQQQIA